MVGESFHPRGCWGEDSNHIRLGATVQKLLRLFAFVPLLIAFFVKINLRRRRMNKGKRSAATLALLLLPASILPQSVQKGEKLEDPPWIKDLAVKRIVYSIPSMKRVTVRKNLVYKHSADTDLKMDVYAAVSQRRSEGRPAVIFIHGGRIPPNLRTTPKDWGAYVSFGGLVAASGFVGITFNHRFYSWNSFGDSQSDVMDLIRYVRKNARTLGVNKDRIVLWAVSAGGIFLVNRYVSRRRTFAA